MRPCIGTWCPNLNECWLLLNGFLKISDTILIPYIRRLARFFVVLAEPFNRSILSQLWKLFLLIVLTPSVYLLCFL